MRRLAGAGEREPVAPVEDEPVVVRSLARVKLEHVEQGAPVRRQPSYERAQVRTGSSQQALSGRSAHRVSIDSRRQAMYSRQTTRPASTSASSKSLVGTPHARLDETN